MTKINASAKHTVAWVLLVGAWSAFVSAVFGAVACLTIVGIPSGIKHFKFIKLLFTSDNVAVTYRPDYDHRAYGLYWYIFGGVFTRILCSFMPFILNLIGAGKSVVLRFDRIAPYLSCPFKVEFVENGHYSSSCDTPYDYKLLQRKIYKAPTVALFDEERNKLITVRRYLKGFENEIFTAKRTSQIIAFLFIGIMIFGAASIIGGCNAMKVSPGNEIPNSIGIGAFLVVVGLLGSAITSAVKMTQLLRIYDTHMKKLFELFDETDPYDTEPTRISLSYVFIRLFNDREERKKKQNTKRQQTKKTFDD